MHANIDRMVLSPFLLSSFINIGRHECLNNTVDQPGAPLFQSKADIHKRYSNLLALRIVLDRALDFFTEQTNTVGKVHKSWFYLNDSQFTHLQMKWPTDYLHKHTNDTVVFYVYNEDNKGTFVAENDQLVEIGGLTNTMTFFRKGIVHAPPLIESGYRLTFIIDIKSL